MIEFDLHWRRIPKRMGLGLGLSLIAYFMLMHLIGQEHNYWLRVVNAFILFAFVRSSIKIYQSRLREEKYDFFINFFKIAMRTAFIGIGIFTLFVAIYLDQINPVFMEELRTLEQLSPGLTPIQAAGIVFIEGFGSAFLVSYISIQLLKKKTVELKFKPEAEL